ncbi:S-adenosyl-L-methionine-dependent methyltransferase [Gigaspora margarita]|uniref:S-adenosyl-L-methionine-dependent methyltransferase n=1 Tax=Gigaspora margarita TaxID=4874 RepID=A0A8H4ELI2_GIGMA|nr:S-adenosyl-L-methionine-dependent methyltransferase [Gigaspora margarita]
MIFIMGCISSKLNEKVEFIDSQNTQTKFQTEFRYADGRRFHNLENAGYPLPNDDEESDRLHLQHFLIRYIWQSNFSSPIDHILSSQGSKILDIGCGAGSWSFDMATTYPSIEVVGLDISSHQPTYIKPKNFSFIKANVLEGIPFEDNTFDFVFQRYLVFGYPKEKWPFIMNEIVRVLKPGGFLELCEPSTVYDAGPVTQYLFKAAQGIINQKGGDPNIYRMLEKYVQNQGQLKNIKREVKRCYHGEKSNNIKLSKVAITDIISLYESLKPSLMKHLQISDTKLGKLIKNSEKELFDFDSFYYMVRVYATKFVDNNN